MARDGKLMIRLEERTKFEFQQLADRYGVTMSSLGSVILGQWIDAQRERGKAHDYMLQSAADGLKQTLGIGDESIAKYLETPEMQSLVEQFGRSIVEGSKSSSSVSVQTDRREL